MEDYILKVINELNKKLEKNNMEGGFTSTKTIKNNGVTWNGIAYTGSKISPVLYLDRYYEEYSDTGNLCIEELWHLFKRSIDELPFDVENILNDWNCFEKRVIFKLVNKNMNEELLKTSVYRDVGEELAIIYLYLLDLDNSAPTASITITNQIAERFMVSEDELYSTAIKNTPKILKPVHRSINEMLNKNGIPFPNDAPDLMSVITNNKFIYGASVMFYPGLMSSIANELHREILYLIPSSIHEIILVDIDEDQTSTIPYMIREINRTEVSPEDILSDNLYQYNASTDEISIISARR